MTLLIIADDIKHKGVGFYSRRIRATDNGVSVMDHTLYASTKDELTIISFSKRG